MKKIQITNLMKKIGNILIEGFEGKNLTVKQLNKKVAEMQEIKELHETSFEYAENSNENIADGNYLWCDLKGDYEGSIERKELLKMDSDFKKIFSVGEVSLDVDKKGFKYIISTYATVTYEDKWGSVERDNVIIKSMEIIDDIIINRYVADMVDNYKEGQQPAAHILIRLKNTLHYAKEPYTFKILDELIVRFEKITKAEKLKIKLANEENRLERVKAKLSNGDLSLNKVVEHIEECIKNCEHIELETFYKGYNLIKSMR